MEVEMNIRFETCDRKRALQFLQKLYPDSTITDTEDSAKAVLDIVEKDIIRIPDPSMHGQRVGVIPSRNWVDSQKDEYVDILTKFHNKYK